jgi:hypothetical protein
MSPAAAFLLAVVGASPRAATPGKPSIPTHQPGADEPSPAVRRVELARLRVRGLELDPFAAALALRLPDVRLVAHDGAAAPTTADSLAVFVDLRPAQTASAFALTIVASDGRAYDRTVAIDTGASSDELTRLLASHVGNLVSAIEAGTAAPDRENVPMPAPSAVSEPVRCPVLEPRPPCPEPAKRVAPPPPTPPAFEIGIDAASVALLGLGAPADADRFAAWGGGAGMRLRHRSGVTPMLDVRVAGRGLPFALRLVRTRVAIGLGYVWRARGFELETAIAFTVEPWRLRNHGATRSLADSEGAARATRPLLGGMVRVVPGHRFAVGERVQLRVGPRLELAASSVVGDRARVAELVIVDGGDRVAIGRLGGIELALGVELTLWIAPRRPRPAPARAAAVSQTAR